MYPPSIESESVAHSHYAGSSGVTSILDLSRPGKVKQGKFTQGNGGGLLVRIQCSRVFILRGDKHGKYIKLSEQRKGREKTLRLDGLLLGKGREKTLRLDGLLLGKGVGENSET